jgi:carbon monoxide dehydrogenase subunit G
MKLNNEFVVKAPVEETWKALLDLQRTASCLPGAEVEPGATEGEFNGKMKVKLGAVTTAYTGSGVLREVDEDEHTAVIEVRGREQRGQGTVSATITNIVTAVPEGSHVSMETDLNITGRQAQFGRGIMKDVADSMLKLFASNLEKELTRKPEAAPAATSAGEPAGAPASDAGSATDVQGSQGRAPEPVDDVLDMSQVMGPALAKRALPAAAVILLAVLAVLIGRSRSGKSGINFSIKL